MMRYIAFHSALGVALLASGLAAAGEDLSLLPGAQVDGRGIFLSSVVATNERADLPVIRLGDSPAFGRTRIVSRAEIMAALSNGAPDTVFTLRGPDGVRVNRRSRPMNETEIKSLLTGTLQRDQVGDRGELELRLTRPWHAIAVPDDPLEVKILDLPSNGVGPNFVTRFELRAGAESIGPLQVALQAKIYREVWVTRSALRAGQLLTDLDLVRERRDVLALREPALNAASPLDSLELADTVAAGSCIMARSVRLRPIIHRGQILEAQVRDGSMVISLKVEALENGAVGQSVRVRNIHSRKELRGKVQDEDTILVSL